MIKKDKKRLENSVGIESKRLEKKGKLQIKNKGRMNDGRGLLGVEVGIIVNAS